MKMRWAGHVVRMGDMRNAYKILVINSQGTRLLSEDNKMDLRETEWEGVESMHLAQDMEQ
jgi:hypothetical protein